MSMVTHCFSDLESMVDGAHALFREWDGERRFYPPATPEALERARLAMHEWLANIVQHADFEERQPEVRIRVGVVADRLRCIVEDNSAGFDMSGRVQSGRELMENLLEILPQRGMGLMIIEASTEGLKYRDLAEDRHLLEFYVSAE